MTSIDDCGTPESGFWSKPRRRARTSVSNMLERKLSTGSSILAEYKMIYQTTEFCQGSDDFDRWLSYIRAPILKQAKKTGKDVCSHHLGAEIACWIISSRTVQSEYIKIPDSANAVMHLIDDCCTTKSRPWRKPRRLAKTSVSTILEQKSSTGSSVLVLYQMIYQITECRQGSDDSDRWLLYVHVPMLKQSKKTSKVICFHHLGAEIVC